MILSDVDVVWLRDAAPYFKCESGDVDGCEEIRGADVMISSDNLSPTMDWELGARYAMRGIFITGMMFIRNTRAGKDFLSDWARNLQAKDGAYSKLTTHQQVFNKMAREENAWPGLDVAPGASARAKRAPSGADSPVYWGDGPRVHSGARLYEVELVGRREDGEHALAGPEGVRRTRL